MIKRNSIGKYFSFHAMKDFVTAEGSVIIALSILIGLLAGLGTVGFIYLIKFIKTVFWNPWGGYSGYIAGDITSLLIPLLPALGGLLLGPLSSIFPTEAKGHGVPEVMESVALRGGVLKLRTVFIRAFASAITIGSGGSAGREGPIAHIGAAIGSYVGQVFKISSTHLRTLLGCGAAGGIAATFNAPIAGVLFSLEIVLGDWQVSTLSPIIMSSVIATTTARHIMGNELAFEVPFYQLVNPVEIVFYIILGLLAGLIALIFIQTLDTFEDLFDKKIKIHPWLKPAMGGLLVGLIGLLFPQIFGNGYEPMGQALMGEMAFTLMLLLVFLKILVTSLTLGSGGSGGVFAPGLYIGAMLGGSFGAVIHGLFPSITATKGAYALVGMGAVLAAAAHAPLTNILILYEMTGDYHIILPIMAACIMSTLTVRSLSPYSIFSIRLIKKGINIEAGKETSILQSIKVSSAMTSEVEAVQEDMNFTDIVQYLINSKHTNFPVVSRQGDLIGALSFQDVREHVFEPHLEHIIVARDLATPHFSTAVPSDNLKDALSLLAHQSKKGKDLILVIDPDNPKKLIGILTRRDILTAYNKAIFKYDKTV